MAEKQKNLGGGRSRWAGDRDEGEMAVYIEKKIGKQHWPAFGVRDIGFHTRSCSFKPDGATNSPHTALHFTPPPHRVHSPGSACDRGRQGWRSACAMRVDYSAPDCSPGTSAHPKIAQRRACDALG